MIDYFSFLAFIPLLFILPPLPYVRRFFPDVPQKYAYGAATSGILLTFYGIWVGLVGFDVTNIEKSIPLLLEGLKTAFGSSIVGLTTSMMINLFFVHQKEDDLSSLISSIKSLETSLGSSSDVQLQALALTIKDLLRELEMGINTETKETMIRFRQSVDFLREWQEKYIEEIHSVTDAMDKNAKVTSATTEQLDRTNDVLEQLGPVTERIAESIGWVQKALPSTRSRGIRNKDEE